MNRHFYCSGNSKDFMNSVPGVRDKEQRFLLVLCHNFTFTAHLSCNQPYFMLLIAHTSISVAVVLDRTVIERALDMLAMRLGNPLIFFIALVYSFVRQMG